MVNFIDRCFDFLFHRDLVIDINKLKDLPPQELQGQIQALAKHIALGKGLKHEDTIANECSLQTLNEKMPNTPSLEVLEDLNAILKRSIEKNLHHSLQKELNIIRSLRDKILEANPITDDRVENLIEDPLKEIFSHISPAEIGRAGTVSKAWYQLEGEAQIKVINQGQLPFKEVLKIALKDMSARQAVEWVINHPAGHLLEYADFSELKGFDNECLQKLIEKCPNLKYLDMTAAEISGDALKYLEKTQQLHTLIIKNCKKLESDALKHLKHTPQLQSLSIEGCIQFEIDALKHLQNTKNLMHLRMGRCSQFNGDGLTYLGHTPGLRTLDIHACKGIVGDALKNLKLIPQLLNLNISYCDHLEGDALKHLVHTLLLQSLSIVYCDQFESDALKHLEKTNNLLHLDIRRCRQLQEDSLKYLVHTPKLQSLNIAECTYLEHRSLRHLAHTPHLQKLDCWNNYSVYIEDLPSNLSGIEIKRPPGFTRLEGML